jgi:hypothetical protein
MAPVHEAADLPRPTQCPACGHTVAVLLFRSDTEPASEVVRCVDCGHVFNAAPDHAAVPYADRPNRTFSGGPGWREHVRGVREEMLARLPASPMVVEIGHGNGDFLATLAEARATGRYVGFDPDGIAEAFDPSIELRRERFVAARALAELSPHIVICRYVLEYLTHPLGFVQQLAFAAACAGIQPLLYLEVPCIDRALETGRTFDFDPAHTSYFTTASFMRMLSRCSPVEQRIGHGYQREVLYAFVRLGRGQTQVEHARAAEAFRGAARESLARLRRQLDALVSAGRSVAIWGGTGEAAAFLAQAGADAARFPIVVDADAGTVGSVVPVTGQKIRAPEWLRDHPVDAIIIPAHRRAPEIVCAMAAADIRCDSVLVVHGGRLVDYEADSRRDARDYLRSTALAS